MHKIHPLVFLLIISLVPSGTFMGTLIALGSGTTSLSVLILVSVVLGTVLLATIIGIYQIYLVGLQHEERLKMIETGNELHDPSGGPSLLMLVCGALALSFGLACLITVFAIHRDRELFGSGLALVFSGLSLMVIYKSRSRDR